MAVADSFKACPENPALGGTANFDFSSPSDRFYSVGLGTQPEYGKDGVSFTINKQGDSPTIQSKFYIMFGHLEVDLKAAPGQGVVSSVVLLSDCLDEIDWEWVGGNNGQVQTNFFARGGNGVFNRATWQENPGNHDGFHKYAIDWTSERIEFSIDGNVVRSVGANDAVASGQYPQTPMFVKLGIWAGGDPNNEDGTIGGWLARPSAPVDTD